MAIHAGEAMVHNGEYHGPLLNRSARLLAIGHGTQILVSETAATLARDGLPPETDLRELGEHRLPDLLEPECVFQLLHPELPADFRTQVARRPSPEPPAPRRPFSDESMTSPGSSLSSTTPQFVS